MCLCSERPIYLTFFTHLVYNNRTQYKDVCYGKHKFFSKIQRHIIFLVNALFAECCFTYCRRKQKTLSVKHTIDSWHLFRSAWYKSLHICMQINSLQWKNRLDSRAFWHCVCVCHISFHLPTIKIGMGYTKMTLTLFIYDRKAIYYILLAHEKESTIESWKAGLIFPCQNSWSHFELWQTVPWCLSAICIAVSSTSKCTAADV